MALLLQYRQGGGDWHSVTLYLAIKFLQALALRCKCLIRGQLQVFQMQWNPEALLGPRKLLRGVLISGVMHWDETRCHMVSALLGFHYIPSCQCPADSVEFETLILAATYVGATKVCTYV